MGEKRRYVYGVPPRERYVDSSKLRPHFISETAKKQEGALLNLLLKYSIPALLMLGLIGIKLVNTVVILYLAGSSPLTGSDNYPMIIGGYILVLLIFGGGFIGITLRKIIGAVVSLLGVIIDIVVRLIAFNELLIMIETSSWFDVQLRWLSFHTLDVLLISLFLISAFYTIKAFRSNNEKKLRLKKLCKKCGKFIVNATPGICPHCGYLIGS